MTINEYLTQVYASFKCMKCDFSIIMNLTQIVLNCIEWMGQKNSFVHHAILYFTETKKTNKLVYVKIYAAWLSINI